MKTTYKITAKTAILVALLVGFNYIYKGFFFQSDLEEHSPILQKVAPASDAQIVYFAESSNFSVGSNDTDTRNISEMASDFYPGLQIKSIHKGALHAEIFKTLLHHLPENNEVETVVITLNVRSFGADWIYSKLETALQKELVLLKPFPPLYNRLMLSFKGYDIKTDRERKEQVNLHWLFDDLDFPYHVKFKNTFEWNRAMAQNPNQIKNLEWDQKKIELACHYIKTYAFTIDPSKNPRIKDFDEIVEICKKNNWNLVFNLLAENIEKANDLVGEDLVFLMKRNRDFLVNRYHKDQVIVVDNLEDVPDMQYIDQDWTTEHYAELGRKIVAKNLADSLKQRYPQHYSAPEWAKTLSDEVAAFREATSTPFEKADMNIVHFSNDMEKDYGWHGINTKTNEKAFSGKFSSKAFSGSPYTITFEHALNHVPDSLRNGVKVSCFYYQTSKNKNAKIVIELRGDGVPLIWNGQNIEFKTEAINEWDKISINQPFNEIDLNKYNTIKAYILNEEKAPIYSDDWKITFY